MHGLQALQYHVFADCAHTTDQLDKDFMSKCIGMGPSQSWVGRNLLLLHAPCVHDIMPPQNEADSKRLQTALMEEGAAGMWDILSGSNGLRNAGVTGAALRGLMAALRKPVLSAEVQLPAVCAVWHACMMAKPRDKLIQVRPASVTMHRSGCTKLCMTANSFFH